MDKDTALRLALAKFEAMNHKDSIFAGEYEFQITAIKAALKKQDKPMHPQLKEMFEDYFDKCFAEFSSKRTWVGLTDEEIAVVEDEYIVDYRIPAGPACIPAGSAWNFAKDIESKLKDKNT
jgi:hypothetical protein